MGCSKRRCVPQCAHMIGFEKKYLLKKATAANYEDVTHHRPSPCLNQYVHLDTSDLRLGSVSIGLGARQVIVLGPHPFAIHCVTNRALR